MAEHPQRVRMAAGIVAFRKTWMGSRTRASMLMRLRLDADRLRVGSWWPVPRSPRLDVGRGEVAEVRLFEVDPEDQGRVKVGIKAEWLGIVRSSSGEPVETGFFIEARGLDGLVEGGRQLDWPLTVCEGVVPSPARENVPAEDFLALATEERSR